ncbi:MAG: hypothetical protein OXU42_15965 [Deltaproteobacteria bacterium]|nr:hypothetical protein [Deltaproteobacteria bacterium]
MIRTESSEVVHDVVVVGAGAAGVGRFVEQVELFPHTPIETVSRVDCRC